MPCRLTDLVHELAKAMSFVFQTLTSDRFTEAFLSSGMLDIWGKENRFAHSHTKQEAMRKATVSAMSKGGGAPSCMRKGVVCALHGVGHDGM